MKVLNFVCAILALLSALVTNAQPTYNILGDWNIWGEHHQLQVSYDMDGGTYTRRIYLMNLSDTSEPDEWILWDTQSGLTGSGTTTIDLFDVPYGPTYKAEIRLIEQGSVNALEEPRPQTEPFATWAIPVMIVDDTPICTPPIYMFTVDVTEHGDGYPYDLAKLYMYIRNVTLDIDYAPIVHELAGVGSMTTENFWIELIDPGNYEICYELTIEDVGFDPDWGPETVISTCSDPLQFPFDISTSVEDDELLTGGVLRVQPNPTSGTITLKGFVPERAIELLDASGRLISTYSGIEQQLDLSALSAGVYILSQGDKGYVRVVKE
jgi:hypothetical protein